MEVFQKLSYISEIGRLSIMLNAAAVFIVLGMIWYTAIYRRRRRLSDRLFFRMELLLVVLSVSDLVVYLVDGNTAPWAETLNSISNLVFFISFALFCGVFALFFTQNAVGGLENNGKKRLLLMLPAYAESVLFLINAFTGMFFYVDRATGIYTRSAHYGLLYIIPLFYAGLSVIMIIKIDPGIVWLFFLLLAVRLILGVVHNGVSSTAICFAIGMVFTHVHVILRPFYEEEKA